MCNAGTKSKAGRRGVVWGYSEIYIYTADVNCYISILDCILCCNIRIDLVLNKVVVVACDFGSRVIDDSLSLCVYYDRNLSVHLSPFHTVKYGNVWLSNTMMHASSFLSAACT